MKIEAGKYYRDRDGKVIGPMVFEDNEFTRWPFSIEGADGDDKDTWTVDGVWSHDTTQNSRYDLIEEVPNPAPVAIHEAEERHGEPVDLAEVIRTADIRNGIDATLAERGTRYGAFTEHARITQALKRAMQDSPNWDALADDQREALEMIAHKAGRILNGDPDYHDSWHDIVGYTKLVADRLEPISN